MLGLAALALAFAWHISVGAKPIPLAVAVEALLSYDASVFEHVVIVDLRLPRALLAAMVGAALAVSGALMQGVTRNPLADPGILGLLIGASFAVVLFVGVLNLAAPAPGGAMPLTLVLSGAAITAFLAALVIIANLLDEQSFEQLQVWMTGSLAGAQGGVIRWALPWFGAGLAVALVIARQITALAMGEETAMGLGMNVGRLKALALFAVVALTAAAVAMAGPMGFVGLVVPHAVRLMGGQDYRRIVPWSAIAGAGYLLVVDVAARMVLAPVEISTGLLFDLTKPNLAIADPANPNFGIQTGEVEVQGFEIEAQTRWRDLRFDANWALLDTENAEGNAIATVPESFGSIWASYTSKTGAARGWKVGAGLRYSGEKQDGSGADTTPDYTLYDARVAYGTDDYEVSLNIRNLADETHMTYCDSGACYFGEGRDISLTTSVKF